jgi:hypothetical protein
MDSKTSEVLSMLSREDDDVTFGRMPVGGSGDESDFDYLPPLEVDITPEMAEEMEMFSGDDDEEAAPFESHEEVFPLFKQALRRFKAAEPRKRVVRIDTDNTFGSFVSDAAVKEIARRVDELRTALEAHESDHHGPKSSPMRKWDEIMGAAEALSDLSESKTPEDAAKALPSVPLDLPAFAEGKVRCWKDGDVVVCSMRFSAHDGTARVATSAALPRAHADDVLGWALKAGVDPVKVLGALPDLSAVACGKRLVKDVAGAALAARGRVDVCGMSDDDNAAPLLLASGAVAAGRAPLAALMHLQQRADAGDSQAAKEMAIIRTAAETPSGRKIAKPLLLMAENRLSKGRSQKQKSNFLQRYARGAGWAA